MTLIYILYAREKKSKNFLYIEGMEMTVTDCHHEKSAVQKREHAKNFRFLGKVCKRPISTYIRPASKSAKKPEKLGGAGRCTSYTYFTHVRKKVNFSLYRRYGNDLHRPAPFSFFIALREEASPIQKQKPLCRLTFLVVLSYNKEKTTAETTATK